MAGDWIRASLAEVVEVISGGTPKTSTPEYWNGTIPWLSVVDFNSGYRWVAHTEKHITDKGLAESSTRLLCERDVIISARGTVGALAQLSIPMAFNQSCYGIRGRRGVSDTDFIFYFLKQAITEMKQLAHGGVFDTITRDTFKLIELSLPPIEEQRSIAHILGTLDDKIELNRKQNETLEAMARTLFKAWFVDFEPVRAKLEGRWQRGQSLPGLPAHLYDLFPDRLVESELGEIPEGWEISALGDFVETVKGRSYKSEELAESTTALVTLKSFARGGGYRTDGLKSFTGKYKQEQVIAPGEVVIACTDVTQAAELIGRAAIVRRARRYQTLVASLDTMIVRPRSERVTRAFLYYLGRSDSFVAHTYSHTTGTTVLHLGKEAIPTYRFVLPPREIVRHFDVTASNALARTDALEDESERLVALRDTLLPKLISGELRVKDAGAFLRERGL